MGEDLKTKLVWNVSVNFPDFRHIGIQNQARGEYIRTPVEVLDEMAELLKTDKPSTAYSRLKESTMRFRGPLAFNMSVTKNVALKRKI